MHLGTIVGIVLAVLVVAAIILAGVYISGHPTSNAALFFIEVGSPLCFCICVSLAIQYLPLPSSSLPRHTPGASSHPRNLHQLLQAHLTLARALLVPKPQGTPPGFLSCLLLLSRW